MNSLDSEVLKILFKYSLRTSFSVSLKNIMYHLSGVEEENVLISLDRMGLAKYINRASHILEENGGFRYSLTEKGRQWCHENIQI